MSSFSRLLAAGGAAHFADQLATAALPLTAVIVLGAGPGTVGTLVALQGLAWLLASLPAGVLVDRVPKRRPADRAVASRSRAGVRAPRRSPRRQARGTALAAACFIGASGAVILVLTALAARAGARAAGGACGGERPARARPRRRDARGPGRGRPDGGRGHAGSRASRSPRSRAPRRRSSRSGLRAPSSTGAGAGAARRRDPGGRPLRASSRAAARHRALRRVLELRLLRAAGGLRCRSGLTRSASTPAHTGLAQAATASA